MSGSSPVSSARKSGSWIVGALISVAALAVALWGVQPARLGEALRGANYWYLIPASAMIVLGLLCRARSWQILLGGDIPLGRTFSALNVGYLLNNVLPFRLGELGRAYLVSRPAIPGMGGITPPLSAGQLAPRGRRNTSASGALSSVVVERLIDVVVSLTGLIAALPFALSADWAPRVAWVSGGIAVGLFASLFLAATLRETLVRWLDAILSWLAGGRFRALAGLADSFLRGLEVLRNPRRLAGAAFWSTLAWGTAWVQVWLAMRMFGIASWSAALFVLGAASFGGAVPASPGSVGVYELSITAGLLAFAVERETAVSVALVSHALVLGVTSAFGAIALAREGQSLSQLAASARGLLGKREEAV